MRMKIMILLSIVIVVILNFSIYEKQKIKNTGEIILLELAPVDPRSLMQGDYMRLRYALERSVPVGRLLSHKKRGYIVISSNENNIAQFIRFYNNEQLVSGEKLLHFHRKHNFVRIVPNSFLFQEGHAKYYANAKYGVFKFDNSGNHVLVALADKNKNIIKVKSSL